MALDYNIKAIIIDIGGVMFELGTHKAIEQITGMVDVPRDVVNEVFHGKEGEPGFLYRRGKVSREEFWDSAVDRLGIDRKMVPQLEEIWHSSYVPVDGMRKLVTELSGNYPLIVFSGNIRERVEYLDKRYDFRKYFRDFVFSFDYGVSKENKAFYEALVKKIPCQPEEAVLVDDMPEFIALAKGFGFKTVQFESANQLRAELRKLGVKVGK
jgi:putative hydrolase of the HAD superfamily